MRTGEGTADKARKRQRKKLGDEREERGRERGKSGVEERSRGPGKMTEAPVSQGKFDSYQK